MPNIIDKFEQEAQNILPPEIYDHIAGGAGNENTLRRNHQIYSEAVLIPRVLNGIVELNTEIELFGVKSKTPVLIAPTAFQTLINPEGEIATAKAAEKSGSIMVVSMMSGFTLEKIASVTSASLWFQLHIHTDFSITQNLIIRAEKARYKAIVITVDIPVMATRPRDIKNQFKIPEKCTPANLITDNGRINLSATEFNPCCSWEDIKKIKLITKLPVILKGIMRPSDAVKAIDFGVDGIIISNHGGRQLDGAAATLEVLPEIAKAIQGKIPLLIDGGIQYGSDVIKAIALGASAILMGRPILWGLAVNGQKGVEEVMNCLIEELSISMRLVGCNSVNDIKKEGHSLVRFMATENNIKLIDQQTKLMEPTSSRESKWPLSKL